MTPEQRKKLMQNIHSSNTKTEIMLRKALWKEGIRYRINYKSLPGSPDIAITKYRIAIFVDGDFWHARGHLQNPGEQIRTNKTFWIKKLRRNVERDKEVNDKLLEMNWIVLRFWESEVKKNINACVKDILQNSPKPVNSRL